MVDIGETTWFKFRLTKHLHKRVQTQASLWLGFWFLCRLKKAQADTNTVFWLSAIPQFTAHLNRTKEAANVPFIIIASFFRHSAVAPRK